MKARVDGLRLAQEQDYWIDNSVNQRASNRSIHSSMMDQSQRDLSLSTISEIPTKNYSLASDRIKHAYRKEKAGSSLTHRDQKKQSEFDNSYILKSARNSPPPKIYPHNEIANQNPYQQNTQLFKYLNQHVIPVPPARGGSTYKSTQTSQREKGSSKLKIKRDLSEDRLRSLSSQSVDLKCSKVHHPVQKNVDNLRSCSQCSTYFQLNKYEIEEEKQKIQYILSVSGSIQNYDIYSNQEIQAENKIMAQYVRKFKRYVDFIVQTNALQVDQELEDTEAKLQIQKEHIEFYQRQEEKYKSLHKKVQNPFYGNNLQVKIDEIKRNIAVIKKEIHYLLQGRGINQSPRELTAIQKATNLQKEVNLYGSLLREKKEKLERLLDTENKIKHKMNPQLSEESQMMSLSQNQSQENLNEIKISSQDIQASKNNAIYNKQPNSSQDNLKDTKWNRSTNVTLDTELDSLPQNRRDTQIKSQRSNLSPNPHYISFSQESLPSQLFLESVGDEQEPLRLNEREASSKAAQTTLAQKQLQKIILLSPYVSHKYKPKTKNDQHLLTQSQVAPESIGNRKQYLEKPDKYKMTDQYRQNNQFYNFTNRRNSMISDRNNSQQKPYQIDYSSNKNPASLEKENKIKSDVGSMNMNQHLKPIHYPRYKLRGAIDKGNPSKMILNSLSPQKKSPSISSPSLKQNIQIREQKQEQLKQQLSKIKNELAEQKIIQIKQIQEQLIEIDKIKNQCQVQEEKSLQLDEMLQKQDNLIVELQ